MNDDAPGHVALIRRYLKARDTNIGQAAASAGINPNTAPSWIRHKNPVKDPPLVPFLRLTEYLEIPLDEVRDAVLGAESGRTVRTIEERLTALETTLRRYPDPDELQAHLDGGMREAAQRSLGVATDLSRQAEGRPSVEGDASNPE